LTSTGPAASIAIVEMIQIQVASTNGDRGDAGSMSTKTSRRVPRLRGRDFRILCGCAVLAAPA
jgi:hypothetical protein